MFKQPKKKILIVSRSFYPQNSPRSFRTTELAKELGRQGHLVKVLTPFHSDHIEFGQKHNLEINDMGKVKWKNFDLKGKRVSILLKRIINRISGLLFEYPNIELMGLVKKALKNESGYDLLISIAVPYPVHWGVAVVWNNKKKENNPAKVWVADCGDPYFGRENDSFKVPFYWGWVEKWFMRKTDYVSVPTDTAYLGYFKEFHHKIKVIPQGFKFEDYQFYQMPRQNDFPTFAFAGLFIPGRRDPTAFSLFLLETNRNFRFHIYTKNSALIDSFIKRAPEKFILHSFIPRMELLEKLHHEVDFVVNFENVGVRQTPSKLIDYMLINKPIISVKSFDLNKENILRFLDKDYSGALKINHPEQYRVENVAAAFLALS
ncbi:glycosyltransferase family protein [Pleomorphovibrio marinus]|uniref:hypothetical protein n=1 Tax=Pleomorphovibrio marinus TaxID=2164132 RepID=UPI000E0AC858|nr:hypothetical protein [Pleomorphovibrio marinus]